jgi:hypothetical protein
MEQNIEHSLEIAAILKSIPKNVTYISSLIILVTIASFIALNFLIYKPEKRVYPVIVLQANTFKLTVAINASDDLLHSLKKGTELEIYFNGSEVHTKAVVLNVTHSTTTQIRSSLDLRIIQQQHGREVVPTVKGGLGKIEVVLPAGNVFSQLKNHSVFNSH